MRKFFADEWEIFITHCGFTYSELEVITLLRRGWHEEDIAAETYTSRSTVKRRKKSIAIKISHFLVHNG
jgi:DNA-binding NarL/FixJ family response regulator